MAPAEGETPSGRPAPSIARPSGADSTETSGRPRRDVAACPDECDVEDIASDAVRPPVAETSSDEAKDASLRTDASEASVA